MPIDLKTSQLDNNEQRTNCPNQKPCKLHSSRNLKVCLLSRQRE